MSNHKGPPVASISVTAKKGDHEYGKIILLHDKPTDTTTSLKETTILCTYSIPFHISIPEFLEFVAPVDPFVNHYRVICDTTPDSYLVLMKFRDPYSASSFYKQYNNRPFSSMEPELCKVLFVEAIQVDSTATHHQPQIQQTSESVKSTIEDTLCPVCLEPMDENITPLLTILCQHTFHCHCLSKWGDGSCPVCRYSQKPAKTEDNGLLLVQAKEWSLNDENECSVCQSKDNLWICLICGHVGCGRYLNAHAFEHYRETSHLYALEIDTKRVWDYAGDNYVHRLIQNAVDGKLVELPSIADEINASHEKLEAMTVEYTYLLTSQLDSQHIYYDSQIQDLTEQINELNSQLKQSILDMDQYSNDKHNIEMDIYQSEKEIEELIEWCKWADPEEEKWKAKCDAATEVLLKEKQATAVLVEKKNRLKKGIQEHEQTIQELNDQIRDLTFFLEAREKVEGDPELEGGTVETHTRQPRKRRGKRS